MKNILCYGDSNTWGCRPGVLSRFPKEVRWTGVIGNLLGENYNVIEDGINGRSTVWDDPQNQCRNGLSGLGYSLYRAKPLDLVILMLGTNDLNYTDAEGYYYGIRILAQRILQANAAFPGTSDVFPEKPRLLLISPIETTENMPTHEESKNFPIIPKRWQRNWAFSGWMPPSLASPLCWMAAIWKRNITLL
jgi:lysophospholipase L1-like esterase